MSPGRRRDREDVLVDLSPMADRGGWCSVPVPTPTLSGFPTQMPVHADPEFETIRTPTPMTRLGRGSTDRSRRITGRTVATALFAVLAVGGCSTVSTPSPPGTPPPGDDRIRATARAIFSAMGLSDRIVEGRYEQRENEKGCATELGIPTEQAWSARRGYSVGGASAATSDPATAYDRAVTHLRGTGWTVQEYEGPFGGAPAFRATQTDSFVLFFGADSTFSVVVGPCSEVFPTLTAPAYHPVPRGRFTTPHPPKPPIRTPTPEATAD